MQIVNMEIVISTRGRPDRQITWDQMDEATQERVIFTCGPDEIETLQKRCPGAKLIIPISEVGLSIARQRVADMFDYVMFLDDDLRFSYKPDGWKLGDSLTKMPREYMAIAMMAVEMKLQEGYGMVGFGPRLHAQHEEHDWKENTRMMRSFAANTKLMREHGIRFDEFQFCQDLHATLEFLYRGIPNALSTHYLTDGPSNTPGGCALYRTYDAMLENRKKFLERHGRVARPRMKAVRWGDMHMVPDMTIQWKKAYCLDIK